MYVRVGDSMFERVSESVCESVRLRVSVCERVGVTVSKCVHECVCG